MIKTDYIIDDGNLYDRVEIKFIGNVLHHKRLFIYNKKLFYNEFYEWLLKYHNCRVDWGCRFIFETEQDMIWFRLKYE